MLENHVGNKVKIPRDIENIDDMEDEKGGWETKIRGGIDERKWKQINHRLQYTYKLDMNEDIREKY